MSQQVRCNKRQAGSVVINENVWLHGASVYSMIDESSQVSVTEGVNALALIKLLTTPDYGISPQN